MNYGGRTRGGRGGYSKYGKNTGEEINNLYNYHHNIQEKRMFVLSK